MLRQDNETLVAAFYCNHDCNANSGSELTLWSAILDSWRRLAKDHVWLAQSPCFEAAPSDRRTPALLGYVRCSYGDFVDDEWFIVHLLLRITRFFPLICVTVRDADDQFLLAECADLLPNWLESPADAENRVYLSGGQLHLVPPQMLPCPAQAHEALRHVFAADNAAPGTLADDAMQRRIAERAESAVNDSKMRHGARVAMPARVLRALRSAPQQLIACCAAAIYTRDACAMRFVTGCATRYPQFTDALEIAKLPFPRPSYALLRTQRLAHLPAPFDAVYDAADIDPNGDRARVLGVLLSIGFALILAPSTASGDSHWEYDSQHATVREAARAALTAGSGGSESDNLWDDTAADDSEDWMVITEADVERWCARYDDKKSTTLTDLEATMRVLDDFGNAESGYEGVEMRPPGAASKDSSSDDDDDDENNNDSQVEGREIFNFDKFVNLLRVPSDDQSESESERERESDCESYHSNVDSDAENEEAARNLLASLRAQEGLSGPLGALLGSLGIWAPGDCDRTDVKE